MDPGFGTAAFDWSGFLFVLRIGVSEEKNILEKGAEGSWPLPGIDKPSVENPSAKRVSAALPAGELQKDHIIAAQ
jgi:hypothetical protein